MDDNPEVDSYWKWELSDCGERVSFMVIDEGHTYVINSGLGEAQLVAALSVVEQEQDAGLYSFDTAGLMRQCICEYITDNFGPDDYLGDD